ncbi:serine hydrolase domain-containing protein [soil metagenome]
MRPIPFASWLTKPFLLVLLLAVGCRQPHLPQSSQAAAAGQVLVPAPPREAGMSAEGLGRVDSLLQAYVDNKWIPGAVAIVARDGKVVYHQAVGLNNVEQGTPMQRDHIFRIASMTKALTSVAVMMLEEEGLLRLDDPVATYIPAFAEARVLAPAGNGVAEGETVPAREPVTVRHLLTHTSGIGYSFVSPQARALYAKAGIPDGANTAEATIGEKMQQLARQPLLHQPGEKWTYGLSTDMLGYLVEVVSKQTLAEFLHNRIFAPLGMKDTYFFLPEEKANRLAVLYTESPEKIIRPFPANVNAGDFPVKGAKAYFSGGSGLVSTAQDYAIFLQMLLNGGEYGGRRLLKSSTVEKMTTNQIGNLSVGENKFGLGFAVAPEQGPGKNLRGIGRYGWSGIYNTVYWVDPFYKTVAVLMTQVVPSSHKDLFNTFERLTNEAILERENIK